MIAPAPCGRLRLAAKGEASKVNAIANFLIASFSPVLYPVPLVQLLIWVESVLMYPPSKRLILGLAPDGNPLQMLEDGSLRASRHSERRCGPDGQGTCLRATFADAVARRLIIPACPCRAFPA